MSEGHDEVLRLPLEGRIDTSNAGAFEERVMAALDSSPAPKVIMDARDLAYISSAGLRVLMKVMRRRTLAVENASSEVYDILDMTGFTELMDVRRRLREVSVEGAELIGRGGNGAVFRLDEETIVKVYFGAMNPLEKIERDREVSRAVFVQGINTAIPFDVVRVGDDYGVVFEMVEADTLGHYLAEHPDEVETMTHRMCDLLKQLHATEFADGVLPDARNLIYHRIDGAERLGLFTDQEIRTMRTFTDALPTRNTFIHGDFHPGNIMVSGGELVLIDVGDSGVGHPINDLMGMHLMYVVAVRSGSSVRYCGLDGEVLSRMWPQFLSEYFSTTDEEKIAYYANAIAGVASLKLLLGVAANATIPDEVRPQIISQMKGAFFDNVDHLVIVP